MKNVLVFYSHNMSAAFLSEQQLQESMAANFCSSAVFDRTPDGTREQLQSKDGHIQFWHFKHCYPGKSAEAVTEKRRLEHWMEKLKATLPEGETLDAIVIPIDIGSDIPDDVLSWLHGLKAEFPHLKVLKCDPSLFYYEKGNTDGRYVWPLTPEAQATRLEKLVIDKTSKDYGLADEIDIVTKNISERDVGNILRRVLELPPLEEKARVR